MAELFTYRPKSGIGKDLPEEELKEFNSITYDKIMNMTDLKKLMRLEQYMREEEFTQTSHLARKRIVDLGGEDLFPNEWSPQFCDTTAEFNEFMKNYDNWQESMKKADNDLLELLESKEEEQSSMSEDHASKQRCKRPLVVNAFENNNIVGEKRKKKKDVRSGREYYEEWDRYATLAEKEIEEDKNMHEKNVEAKKSEQDDSPNKKVNKKETLQQRLLDIGKSKSMTEREWFAEREREKGNDLFKAKEYSSSIDAYDMAIELFPTSPLAYGNRAASNLKLKKWEEVIKDCDIAIKLDGLYMKAYMRRAIAYLEMEKPNEAIIDLNIVLESNPSDQETHTILRRAQFMLKKIEDKHATEVELERAQKKEVEIQEAKKDLEIFKNMTYSSPPSNNFTRMIIEEVEDVDIVEQSKLKESENNSIEHNISNDKNQTELINYETIVTKCEEKTTSTPTILNWPCRPHKHSIQPENLQKLNQTTKETFKEDNIVNNNIIEDKSITHDKIEIDIKDVNDINNIKVKSDNESKSLEYEKTNERELMFSKLSEVDVPQEIIEAIKTQDSIPIDHVAFGHTLSKDQSSPVCKSSAKCEEKPYLKSSNNLLAEEWRLNGNTYFSQGKFVNAVECYTTSLSYKQSVASYSNRAISRIKLKNFKGAEDDTTHAISLDCKNYKAYYRRGLARSALGNLQGAKLDFEEALNIVPNNEEVLKQLASIDLEYIPMRSGPMIFEEINEEEECKKKDNQSCNEVQNSYHDMSYDSHHVIKCNDENQSISTSQKINEIEPKSSISSKIIANEECLVNKIEAKILSNKNNHCLAKDEQEKGNTCFRKKQFTLAVDCYTQSLSYDRGNAVVLANRALCYINLHDYKRALIDSSEAIQNSPNYSKAYHRRAMANDKLGDYENALKDYQTLAVLLPNDKDIQKRIIDIKSKLQKIAHTSVKCIDSNKTQRILTHELCDNDDILLKPVKTMIFNDENKAPTMQDDKKSTSSSSESLCAHGKSSHENNEIKNDHVDKRSAPVKVLENIENSRKLDKIDKEHVGMGFAPTIVLKNNENIRQKIYLKPTSALEFERVCNSLKEYPDLAKNYVKSIEPQKYPFLFKESLSASIMQCFIYILRKGFMPSDAKGAIDVLYGLTKIKRFSLILLLITSSDKQGLETILYWLEFSSESDIGDIQELRKAYQIL